MLTRFIGVINFDVFNVISEVLIELEPMVRKFCEIAFLEAVLEIKRSKVSQESCHCLVELLNVTARTAEYFCRFE